LSQARADAVLNALLARRVLTKGLTARGYGESQPIADNESEEGRELNRRIEFKLISSEEDEADAALHDHDSEAQADQTSETETANE
jgi:OOP family OmpA-OmpF porin